MDRAEIEAILDNRPRDRRSRLRWTQAALAEKAGVSRPVVVEYEHGRRISPRSRAKIDAVLDEAITRLDREEQLLAELGSVGWGTVKSVVEQLDAKVEAGDLDPDTAVVILGQLIERIRSNA